MKLIGGEFEATFYYNNDHKLRLSEKAELLLKPNRDINQAHLIELSQNNITTNFDFWDGNLYQGKVGTYDIHY